MTLKWKHANKTETKKNGNRAIWLVYRTDTNARGFWLVKRTLGWKNFMPENFLEINRYFALTSYCNTIGQSNNVFSILGFSLAGKRRGHVLFHWLIKQITNTYLNHFSRSYENRSNMLSNVRIFIVLRSEEGLTSTNKDKSANSSGEKTEQLRILKCVRSEWKTSNQISTRTRSRPRI